MTLANTKNGLRIMLGLCGDEFWRVSGGVKYAFYSKKQIDEGKSLNCRAKKSYDFLYSTWDDKIRARVIHNLNYGILACNDPILRSLYSKKPPPFVPDEFINRRGMKIEVSDVFTVKVYPRLDSLRKELVAKYPDVEFRGIVVDSAHFDSMCEKKRQHKNLGGQKAKSDIGQRVKLMKDMALQSAKDRYAQLKRKTAMQYQNNSSTKPWFESDWEGNMVIENKRLRDNAISMENGGHVKDRF